MAETPKVDLVDDVIMVAVRIVRQTFRVSLSAIVSNFERTTSRAAGGAGGGVAADGWYPPNMSEFRGFVQCADGIEDDSVWMFCGQTTFAADGSIRCEQIWMPVKFGPQTREVTEFWQRGIARMKALRAAGAALG